MNAVLKQKHVSMNHCKGKFEALFNRSQIFFCILSENSQNGTHESRQAKLEQLFFVNDKKHSTNFIKNCCIYFKKQRKIYTDIQTHTHTRRETITQ